MLKRLATVGLMALLLQGQPAASAPQRSKPMEPANDKLLRLIFPDLDASGVAHKSVEIHHIHGDFEPVALSGTLKPTVTSRHYIRNGGKRDLLLEIAVNHVEVEAASSWGEDTLLALVSLPRTPRLLDVVDIQSDRESGLWSDPTMLNAGTYDTPIIYFSHLSAGADFLGLEIVELVHNKLVPSRVTLPLFHSMRSTTADITERPSLRAVENAKPPQAIFTLKITGKRFIEDTDTVKSKETKTFSAVLNASDGRWRCARCATVGKAALTMEKHFGFVDD